jgi:hypothetical protein
MTLGAVQPGAMKVMTVGKDSSGAITAGAVCVPDTSTAPDSYKIAPASASVPGPFVVCVNRDAAATDTAFSAAFPGTSVTVKAQGTIEVGKEVQCSASVSGSVAAFVASTIGGTYAQAEAQAAQLDRLRVVGRYICHDNGVEMSGKTPATAAADGDAIIIMLGGVA